MLASVSAAMSTSLLPSVVIQRLPEQYLPIIHLVFANLKTWLIGIHHGVSHQHLQAYLNEVHLPLQQAVLPVQRLPLIARHRGRHLCSNLCRALLGRVAAPYM